MASYAKDIKHRVEDVKGEVIEPMARGAAIGSEKIAEGSEALADSARRLADKTQHWADGVTGARRRRISVWLALVVSVIGAVVYLLVKNQE